MERKYIANFIYFDYCDLLLLKIIHGKMCKFVQKYEIPVLCISQTSTGEYPEWPISKPKIGLSYIPEMLLNRL